MAFVAIVLPIVPGQEERAASFEREVEPHRERYEELNRLAGVKRHLEWVFPTPQGSVLLMLFETDTPERLGRAFQDDAYDRWWIDRVRTVHGFDPRDVGSSDVPSPSYVWTAPGVEP